jgi:hypothetical protein
VEYYESAFSDNEDWQYQLGCEHEYVQAELALDALEDPILRELARACNQPNQRKAEQAREELLALSRRVKNLFPRKTISTRTH